MQILDESPPKIQLTRHFTKCDTQGYHNPGESYVLFASSNEIFKLPDMVLEPKSNRRRRKNVHSDLIVHGSKRKEERERERESKQGSSA